MEIHTVILAAGEGTRMLSSKAKALQILGGSTMLNRIYKKIANISNKTSIVVGHQKESVINEVKDLEGKIFLCEQKKPIGTADAVKVTLDTISDEAKVILPPEPDA